MPRIIEIKARTKRTEQIRETLLNQHATFKGLDHQIDTYFNVKNGRLKLREGNIENHLIHYFRENKTGPKLSRVTLYKTNPSSSLKKILSDSLGIMTVVDKKREIYFIKNVKFHLDQVEGLGTFVEIEAIDRTDSVDLKILHQQCNYYLKLFEIEEKFLVNSSYSDLLLDFNSN